MNEHYCKANEAPKEHRFVGLTKRDIAIRAIEAYLTSERRDRRKPIATQILVALERLGWKL